MCSDINILSKLIIKNALVVASKDQHNKNVLTLKEFEEGGALKYQLYVRNTPENIIAIKTDDLSFSNSVFECQNNECKMADYAIIANDLDKKWMIYIELKQCNNASRKYIINQIEGTKCFIEYCRVIGKTFFGEPAFLDQNDYDQRYVSVKNIGVNKKTFIASIPV